MKPGEIRDSLVSVSGAEYRRLLAENAVLRTRGHWKTDADLLCSAAALMDAEAQTWREGFGVKGDNREWIFEGENKWAEVRVHNLARTAERLRGMAARIARKKKDDAEGGA